MYTYPNYLLSQGYRVSVESPLRVKRAFHPAGHKSDPVDSRQIAEYAYRFQDELNLTEISPPKEYPGLWHTASCPSTGNDRWFH